MLKRWSIFILMMSFFLVLSSLGAQAEPYPPFEPHPNYHHPHGNGNAYGWHGSRHHASERHRKHFQRSCKGPHNFRPYAHQVYAAQPQVAYVAPVMPIIGIQPAPQPQPMFSPPAAPGLHGQITF